MAVSSILYIILMALYGGIFKQILDIDRSIIKFYIDNKCSSMVVNYSFEQTYDQVTTMFMATSVGLFLSLILFLANIFATLYSLGIIGNKKCEE